tara:strand:- start:8 stop:214 length:207 start_codon:yes stop_codon:yes gene_type:complete
LCFSKLARRYCLAYSIYFGAYANATEKEAKTPNYNDAAPLAVAHKPPHGVISRRARSATQNPRIVLAA